MDVSNQAFTVGFSISQNHRHSTGFLDDHSLGHTGAAAAIADDDLAFHQ
jgi:hypothetical protein